jgi:hypothetical protein
MQGQRLILGRIGDAVQCLRRQQLAWNPQSDGWNGLFDGAMQHRRGTYRRQQQHRRFRRQRGQLIEAPWSSGFRRQNNKRRSPGQQDGRSSAKFGTGAMHRAQPCHRQPALRQ